MNYETFGDEIVRLVGGVDNIIQLNHCITRLRFNLIDDTKADSEALKSLQGVFGVVNANHQYQVVVGGEVDPTYKMIMKKYDFEQGKVKTLAVKEKEKFSLKNVWKGILDYMSGTMVQIIPLFIGCGLINVVLAIGNMFFGLDKASSTYLLINSIGNSVFYFLPLFAAIAAAKKLNCNPFLAVVSVTFLLHPSFIGLGTAASATTLFGIEFNALTYSGTLFPALLSTWILSKIEDPVYAFFPAICRSIFGPFVCIVIVTILNLYLLGPIGYFIGYYLVQFILLIQNMTGPFAVGFIGGIQSLLVMIGAHTLLAPTMVSLFAEIGFDSFIRPAFVACNFAGVGATLAVALMTKNKQFKGVSFGATLTSFLGTSEPALYGVLLPLKKPFLATMIGGFVGGTLAGLLGCKAYAMAKNGIWALMVFQDTIVQISIVAVVSFAVAFLLTWLLKFDDIKLND